MVDNKSRKDGVVLSMKSPDTVKFVSRASGHESLYEAGVGDNPESGDALPLLGKHKHLHKGSDVTTSWDGPSLSARSQA